MNIKLSTRHFIRILSFAIAITVILSSFAVVNHIKFKDAEMKVEYSYLRSIDNLADYMTSIDKILTKSMYVGTPELLTSLSTNLWKSSSNAKMSLSQLPVEFLNLSEVYKYLSQVGEYAIYISKKGTDGLEISEEERLNMKSLAELSRSLMDQIMILQDGIYTGSISIGEVKSDIDKQDDNRNYSGISDNISDIQEKFSSYPKLIYDGPYSDHIMEKSPEKLVGLEEVSREEAKNKASKVSGIDTASLQDDYDEEGKMSSYRFKTNDSNISITKQGGLVSYMVKNRDISSQSLTNENGLKVSGQYLKSLGINNIVPTYHEIRNNIMTINYAHEIEGVVYYTDLIKVSVAMDSGEIMGFDARGYIVNNKVREFAPPSISKEKAITVISPLLKVEDIKLTVIPTNNIQEELTYQLTCKTEDDKPILVYINAYSGKEEDILILIITEEGILTV